MVSASIGPIAGPHQSGGWAGTLPAASKGDFEAVSEIADLVLGFTSEFERR